MEPRTKLEGTTDSTPPPLTLREAIAEVPRLGFLVGGPAADEGEIAVASSGREAIPSPAAVEAVVKPLDLSAGARVFQIRSGSGYIPAVLSRLAGEVYTVEPNAERVDAALRRFSRYGYENVQIRRGDAFGGWPEFAPFDRMLLSTPVATVPRALLEQLAPGGIMVAATGTEGVRSSLVRLKRTGKDKFSREQLGEVDFSQMLGDILEELGAAKRGLIEDAARLAAQSGRKLGEVLLESSSIDEADLYRGLALQRGLKFARVDTLLKMADPAVALAVPQVFLERHQVLPLAKKAGTLVVATTNPSAAIGDLGKVVGARKFEVYLTSVTDYHRLWASLNLGSQATTRVQAPLTQRKRAEEIDLLKKEEKGLDSYYLARFDALVLEALGERASDIHLELYGGNVRGRIRVDGELRDLTRLQMDAAELSGILNVIKIRADLDIAERRRPQGGRFRVRFGGKSYDLRVQTQPSLDGEHAIIRVLPQESRILTIEDLGMPPHLATKYLRLLQNPGGLVLVVGPTGSGKSTTLYAGLQLLARDGSRKVITVEDPIEYSLPNVQQTQINNIIGFTFATAMRAFVRQDPDVILVGEIRDGETALEALRAAQTGHLVLSTLHCKDSTDAVQRLVDLGMHRNSISAELVAVLAQRLAKRVCDRCKEVAIPDPEFLAELFPSGVPGDFECYQGCGCRRCSGHGTHGRIAVTEFLEVDRDARAAISGGKAGETLRDEIEGEGLWTLRDHALELVKQGIIPLSELKRILPYGRLAGAST